MKKAIENSLYAIKYIKKYHSSYFYTNILLSFSESFVAVLTVLSTRFILNAFTSKRTFNDIYFVIILLALVNIIDGIIRSFVKYKITPKATQNIRARMQRDLFAKAANINPACYDTNSFYDKYCLALQNSENRVLAVLNELNAFISAVLKSFSLLLIVLALQPWLILIVVVLVIWNLFFSIKNSKYTYEYSLSIVPSQRKMSYINRVFYVKKYSQELRTTKIKEVLLNRFEENLKEINKQIDYFSKFLLRIQLVQINFQVLINNFILIVLAKQIFSGTLGIGDFFALTTSVSQLVAGFQDIFKTIPHLYENSLYIQNYRDFFPWNLKINLKIKFHAKILKC